MSIISICVYCGEEKQHPVDTCNICTKSPQSRTDEINSLILSFDSCSSENYLSLEEVRLFSTEIKKGSRPNFDGELIKRAEDDFELINKVGTKEIMIFFAKFGWLILPLFAIIYFTLIA